MADPESRTAPRSSPRRAAFMLVLATLLWGLSFPLTKNWQQAAVACPGGPVAASLSLIAVRILLALLILGVLLPRLFRAPSRRDHRIGLLIGTTNFLGIALQVLGLAWTTPALSGFFTSLASAWVPLFAFLCFRASLPGAVLLGLTLGIAGAGVLGVDLQQEWLFGVGDWLTLGASFVFTVLILMLDRLGRAVPPGYMMVSFLVGTGLPALVLASGWAAAGPGIGVWLTWLGSALANPAILRDVVLLTVCSTVGASYLLIVYQPHVSAGRAALIYLLEPVFAAAFSIAWGHDELTPRLLLGGALILSGNLFAELPLWWRELVGRWGGDASLAEAPAAPEALLADSPEP
jgi:drug/metabolite transporter (DMT)-like permease